MFSWARGRGDAHGESEGEGRAKSPRQHYCTHIWAGDKRSVEREGDREA